MDNPCLDDIFRRMTFDGDIIIVGGGLNGTTLALALASTGASIILIDALPVKTRKDARFDGRSYALALTSTRLLEGIGIWDAVAGNAQPMLEIKVTDGRSGSGPSPFFMHFDHSEIEEGPVGYMVEDRHLRHALLNAVKSSKSIQQISGDAVIAQHADTSGVAVTLA
ncbi:MAG: FAD-dependent monooxygenase, partial [Sulfitobacter sp.]